MQDDVVQKARWLGQKIGILGNLAFWLLSIDFVIVLLSASVIQFQLGRSNCPVKSLITPFFCSDTRFQVLYFFFSLSTFYSKTFF